MVTAQRTCETFEDDQGYELLEAVECDDIDSVRYLLQDGVSPNWLGDDHITPLQIASAFGYYQLAKILLDAGSKPDSCNECGFTPLLHASRNGHVQIVKLLLSYGADPLRTTFYGASAMTLAAAGGHFDMISLLSEFPLKAHRRAPSPLIAAVARQHYELVIHFELLSQKHIPNSCFYDIDAHGIAQCLNDRKMSVLFDDLGIKRQRKLSKNRLIISNEQKRNSVSKPDIRNLIQNRRADLLEKMFRKNTRFELLPAGMDPLLFAAIVGDVNVANVLLKYVSDLNASVENFTPIMIAVACGNDLLTNFLLNKGADLRTNQKLTLYELASCSVGISHATTELLLTEFRCDHVKEPKIRRLLKRPFERVKPKEHPRHLIELATLQHMTFYQKVCANLGDLATIVPKKLFELLAWPDDDFISDETLDWESPPVLCSMSFDEKIMVDDRVKSNTEEQFQNIDSISYHQSTSDCEKPRDETDSMCRRFISNSCLSSVQKNSSTPKEKKSRRSISALHSNLFSFSDELNGMVSPISFGENVSKNSSPYSFSSGNRPLCANYIDIDNFWEVISANCSPDACEILKREEIDSETFMLLTEQDFIELNIDCKDMEALLKLKRSLRSDSNRNFSSCAA